MTTGMGKKNWTIYIFSNNSKNTFLYLVTKNKIVLLAENQNSGEFFIFITILGIKKRFIQLFNFNGINLHPRN